MSKQTKQELESKIKELQAALKVVQEQDDPPLAFIGEYCSGYTGKTGNKRLVIRVTKGVRQAVLDGAEYVSLRSDGSVALASMGGTDVEYVRHEYRVKEVIFE